MVRIVDSGDSGDYRCASGGEVTAEVLITRRQETHKLNVESDMDGKGCPSCCPLHTTSV